MSPRPSLRPLAGIVLRTQPDARLVTLFRDGHEGAFEEIVRRYRPALVGFAGGIVPRHQAEDIVQESLVRAHAALQGQNDIEVRPWLYTIVRNRALNAVRDEHPHEHLSEDYDGVPQPPDVLGRKEELTGLVARLKALPDTQRQALVKRELEGRSHEEIALALGATPGAVRGLIFRAREGLRAVGGFVVPSTLLDAVLGSPATTGALGGMAAAGGAGVLLKAGAAASIGVIAVGSGIAINHRSKPNATTRVADAPRVGHFAREAVLARPGASKASAAASPGSSQGDDGGGPGSSSGPGPGGDPSSSNSGSGSSGSGSSGATAGSSSGGSGSRGGDSSGGDRTPSDDGGGSGGGSGGGDDGPSGSGGGDHGGSGGGTSGGDDGGSTSGGDGGGSGSGDDGSGDDSGDGSGDGTTTTTPTTTTPPPGDGSGDTSSPPSGDD